MGKWSTFQLLLSCLKNVVSLLSSKLRIPRSAAADLIMKWLLVSISLLLC